MIYIVFSCKRLRLRAHDPCCLAFHQGLSSQIKQTLIIRTAEEDHVTQPRTHRDTCIRSTKNLILSTQLIKRNVSVLPHTEVTPKFLQKQTLSLINGHLEFIPNDPQLFFVSLNKKNSYVRQAKRVVSTLLDGHFVLEPTVSVLDRVDCRSGGTCLSDRNIRPKF